MNSLVLPLAAIVLYSFAYRYYVTFVANKVARVDPSRPTPATTQADGRDFVKTNKFVLFGHHFAAISASGPLIGPVLAAQFGYLPGALWILFGAALRHRRDPVHHHFAPGRSGHCRGERAGELALGNVHRGDDDSGGASVRVLHVPAPARTGGRGIADRGGADPGRGPGGALARALSVCRVVHAPSQDDRADPSGLRLHRGHAAGVAPVVPARLPLDLHED